MEKAQAQVQTLCSDSSCYLVMDVLGEGCFGKVARCFDFATGNTVAVKIGKTGLSDDTSYEIAILKELQTTDADKKNIVKFMESFRFEDISCLVFEMLDKSLWDLMMDRECEPMNLNEIRPITHQLLVAFDVLKDLGIIHTDLKLDNIMLVNHSQQPYKIKLIDFGLARPEGTVEPGTIMQPLLFRAPEVTLGLPISTAVDMWSLGVVMANLYFATCLFPDNCEYNWVKAMLYLLGQPDKSLLAAGDYTWKFFTWEWDLALPNFRFNSPEEYQACTGCTPEVSEEFYQMVKSLDDVVLTGLSEPGAPELEDRKAFLHLLKCILNVNAFKRIRPQEALNHSFITMAHLVGKSESISYLNVAAQLMTFSNQYNSYQSADQSWNNVTNVQERSYQESLPMVCDFQTYRPCH
ncbi:hypothetical protein Q5P01_018001 [Channa striata]|uniref:Protein kinase domain-containing protein n=1 Tax=Channa striata TaxID=64152 RepID=A0AA88M3Z5_CHASR|nr:hypothetical protein Q5P01_018001 [Channa striata]